MTFLFVHGQKCLKMHKESCKIVSWYIGTSNTGRKEWLLCHPVFCWANDILPPCIRRPDFYWDIPFSNSRIWCFSCSNGAFNLDHVYLYTHIGDFLKCGAACGGDFLKCGIVKKMSGLLLSTAILCERKNEEGIRGLETISNQDDRHCWAPVTRTSALFSRPMKEWLGCTHSFLHVFSYWWY